MKVKFCDISWDTDNETPDLPSEVTLEVDNDLDVPNDGADVLSDKFGWCVNSFNFEIVQSAWDARRESMLADTIRLTHDLDTRGIPHVSTDINHVYVHFYDEDGEDIGNLGLGLALHALYEDIYIHPEAGPEISEGEFNDLDLREARTVDFQTH
jgi:hypothetical protein